jgi:hypothetical protein
MSADATPMGFPERRQHGTKRSMAEPGAKTLAVLQFDKSSVAIGVASALIGVSRSAVRQVIGGHRRGIGVHRRLPQ